uniref:Uncharacterized protein n=1 Tax=Aegilops tauschii subsp. strangulata TaxID=200361 RepID=A0A453J6J0_AEGTS
VGLGRPDEAEGRRERLAGCLDPRGLELLADELLAGFRAPSFFINFLFRRCYLQTTRVLLLHSIRFSTM